MTSKPTGARKPRDISPVLTGTIGPLSPAPHNRVKCKVRLRERPIPASTRVKKRREREPRFLSILTDEQIRSSELIALGFHLRTAGLGMRTQSFSCQPKSTGNIEDRHSDLMRRFTRWAVKVRGQGLSLAVVLDIIVFGKSCRTVDRERRKRNGFARAQLIKSLDLYSKI